jgi:DNA-binding transcriptional ArsR family regulator
MSGEDEKVERLRREVKSLKEQLSKIAEELEPEPEKETEDQTGVVEAGELDSEDSGLGQDQTPFEEREAPREDAYEETPDRSWGRKRYSSRYPRDSYMKNDWGDRLGDYIEGFVEDVMEGVSSEVERSLFWDRRSSRERPTILNEEDVKRIVSVMSAMGNEHRVKILRELTWGGLYSSDLQDTLKEISPSTLSSHLDVLQDAGLVIQEQRRGRYLITMSGRLAIKMASSIAKRSNVKFD